MKKIKTTTINEIKNSSDQIIATAEVVEERYPNEVPPGLPPLPSPNLVYLGKGPLRNAKFDSKMPLYALDEESESWTLLYYSNGMGIRLHYAADARSEYAKKFYPELVEAMEYEERKADKWWYKAKEWFEAELPSPYKELAIANIVPEKANKMFSSTRYSLLHAFEWDDTIQGEDFWFKVDQWLLSQESRFIGEKHPTYGGAATSATSI